MSDKKHLKKLDKTKLFLKNIGGLRFFPIIVLDIIVPILIIINVLHPENIEHNLLITIIYIFPFTSVWFSLFVMKEFIETEGKEIYYMLGKINILNETFKFFLIVFSNVLLLLIVVCIILPEFVFEIIRISVACLFYFSIIYFISMISKSTSIALFFAILYTLINVIFKTNNIRFLIYATTNVINESNLIQLCFPLLIFSLILIILGKIIEKRINIFD